MVDVRPAEPADLSKLVTFDFFPGDRIDEILDRRMLVVEVSGLVVGYVAWQHRGCIDKNYVNKLVVEESFRRQGVASTLLAALGTVLCGRVFMAAGARNMAARALLNGSGWTYAGEVEGLLPNGEAQAFYHTDLS